MSRAGVGTLAGWGARALRQLTRDTVVVAGVAVVEHFAQHHPRMLEDALKVVRAGTVEVDRCAGGLTVRRLDASRAVYVEQQPSVDRDGDDAPIEVTDAIGTYRVPNWREALQRVDAEIDRQGLIVLGWAEVLRG